MKGEILIAVTLALVVGVSCGQHTRAPLVPLEPPPIPGDLTVAYIRESDGQPLQQVRAFLVCCLGPSVVRDTLRAGTGATGSLRFTGLRPGHYVLSSASLAYRLRRDTIIIGTLPPPKMQVTMHFDPICLGSCPQDPRLVAAARARRKEWGCDTDKARVRQQREEWISILSSDSAARSKLGVTMDSGEVSKRVVPITTRLLCRRAGELFDRRGTISTLDFTLFRFGNWILVSPANQGWVFLVLDRRFNVVADFSVLQE
jgi:hypothetical protein